MKTRWFIRLPFLLALQVIVVLINVSTLYAQSHTLQLEHFSSKDGLPNQFIWDIEQDAQGFIWVGTNYGLARYDGQNFRSYLKGTSKLPENGITGLIRTNDSLLFIRHSGYHLSIFDPISEDFYSFSSYFKHKFGFSIENWINPGFGLSNSFLLTNSSDSTVIVEDKLNSLKFIDYKVEKSVQQFLSLNEYIYLLNSDSLFIYHCPADTCVQISSKKAPLPNKIYFLKDNIDQLWKFDLLTQTVYRLNSKTGEFIHFTALPDTTATSIAIATDQKDKTWIITATQVFIFTKDGQLTHHFPSFHNQPLPPVKSTFVDRQNQVWLGTVNGLFKLRLQQNYFNKYFADGKIKDFRNIHFQAPNTLYVGIAQTPHNLLQSPDSTFIIKQLGAVDFIVENSMVWHTHYSKFLKKLDISTGKETLYALQDTTVYHSNNQGYHLEKLYRSKKTGRLWVTTGSQAGLVYFNPTDSLLYQYSNFNNFSSFASNIIFDFYETPDGIWVGGSQGLFLLDEGEGIVEQARPPFNAFQVYDIYEDSEGIFWLATKGSGLIRWNRQTDEWQQFTTRQGLSHDVIYAVYEDDYGYLWLPSNYGLMRFNKNTYQVNTYTTEDGLPHEEFNYFSHAAAPDGRLFLGTMAGVISFHPKDFLNQGSDQFNLVITKLEVWDSETGARLDLTNSFHKQSSVTLSPNQKSFTLDVALLDFTERGKTHLAYRINPLHNEWLYSNSNSIIINDLPHGQYELQIKGESFNGQWSAITRVPIYVLRPFYLQWWFMLLLSIFTTGTIVMTIRYRSLKAEKDKQKLRQEIDRQTKQIQNQADKLWEIDTFKSRLFANISHEIRTPISLILPSINEVIQQSGLDDWSRKKLLIAQRNTHKVLDFVQDILNLSKVQSAQISLEEESTQLLTITRQIVMTFESLAKFNDIHYTFHSDINHNTWVKLDQNKYEKILNNLLSNALKFTPSAGSVQVSLSQQGEYFCMEVQDSGVGIAEKDLPYIFDSYYQSADQQRIMGGIGLGLSIAKEYAQLMNGTLSVKSNPEKGSLFTFVFPKKEGTPRHIPQQAVSNTAQLNQLAPAIIHKENIPHVLVVEDDPDMQQLICDILQQHYQVQTARNGKVALQYLKNIKEKHNIPIIMLTARADQKDKMKALRIGVDCYLFKPFHKEELLVRAAHLITNYQTRLTHSIPVAELEEQLSVEENWLERVEKTLLKMIQEDPDFTVTQFAKKVYLSNRQLLRRLQKETGLGTSDYIQATKLEYAKYLLDNQKVDSVRNAAMLTGYSNLSHFSKIFKTHFGKLPSECLKRASSI